MSFGDFTPVTLASLKRRSGLKLRDGRRLIKDLYGERPHGRIHDKLEASAKSFFSRRKFSIFPHHTSVGDHFACADFAAARFRRVILVECLVGWSDRNLGATIEGKMSLRAECELWFAVGPDGKDYLKCFGYKARQIPSGDLSFWICWPPGAKLPNKAPQPTTTSVMPRANESRIE